MEFIDRLTGLRQAEPDLQHRQLQDVDQTQQWFIVQIMPKDINIYHTPPLQIFDYHSWWMIKTMLRRMVGKY